MTRFRIEFSVCTPLADGPPLNSSVPHYRDVHREGFREYLIGPHDAERRQPLGKNFIMARLLKKLQQSNAQLSERLAIIFRVQGSALWY